MSQKTLLVIDDDTFMRIMITETLMQNHYYVLCVDNGKSGIEAALSQTPHGIILDMNMPEMSGIETLKHLKSDPFTINIPVMMLTGSQKSTDIDKSLKLGAKDYIIKPFDAQKLLKRVDRLLT